jgi:hypothetical protein
MMETETQVRMATLSEDLAAMSHDERLEGIINLLGLLETELGAVDGIEMLQALRAEVDYRCVAGEWMA